ncbi:ATP-dependent Clp protease proteolytic subunit [Mesorhizobium sp. M0924]|uniref:SDH family Clp fold serine proteinase n=1 Tax=unclassified Mesorhizobium TaxID=325217 RepID=UPI0033375C33
MKFNPYDLDHTIVHHIDEKAKLLEDAVQSDVIAYFGQISPQYFRPFRNFIEEVASKSSRNEKTLSIVLRTPGGSAETAERMVNVMRHHYQTVNFIVPDIAMSAGTILCMAGDAMHMDYSSALGPIDPQVMAPDGSGYVAALGYLDKVQEITAKQALSPADVVFLRSLDLAKLALYEQARDLSIDLLKKWLVDFKFKEWTHHRTTNVGTEVTASEKLQRAEEIATALSDHRRWHSHGRALSVDKLKALRLEIDDYSANETLRSAIRGYNDLLTAYTDRMGLPFIMHSHLSETLG